MLAEGYKYCGPTGLAPLFKVNSRTVQRQLLDAGLANPGRPVYTDVERETEDGVEQVREYLGCSGSDKSAHISNNQLDSQLYSILELFPSYGRRMIDGHPKLQGYIIQRSRILESYARVHGPPATTFDP
jgi:hypothetical protein